MPRTPSSPAAVIITAGGIGRRMGGHTPKQFLALHGRPILVRTLEAFIQSGCFQSIILTIPRDHILEAQALLSRYGLATACRLVPGGETRQDSVRAGLESLDASCGVVLVHDAVRPLISQKIIVNCLEAVRVHGAAITAIRVKDTIKEASSHVETKTVVKTVVSNHMDNALPKNCEGHQGATDARKRPASNTSVCKQATDKADGAPCGRLRTVNRDCLWRAQTPQGARVDLLRQAYQAAIVEHFSGTDEASLLERINCPICIVEGSEINLKITHPEDIPMAEALLASRQTPSPSIRTGHGYDAHRLVSGRLLILGGVTIPHAMGLFGHSDADVLTHALCDALLGAIGAGDIGQHFPDSDPQYKGIDSVKLLSQVVALAAKYGFALSNADITVIAQQPKLAPHLPQMQKNLAEVCQVLPSAINIKATTTERMGFAGREEGIACHAVVLVAARPQ